MQQLGFKKVILDYLYLKALFQVHEPFCNIWNILHFLFTVAHCDLEGTWYNECNDRITISPTSTGMLLGQYATYVDYSAGYFGKLKTLYCYHCEYTKSLSSWRELSGFHLSAQERNLPDVYLHILNLCVYYTHVLR